VEEPQDRRYGLSYMNYYRVYKNGSRSELVVLDTLQEVEALVAYNKVMRFGCAQLVDGECVYKGYLSEEEIEIAKQKYGKG
jgi:hypothetical protein